MDTSAVTDIFFFFLRNCTAAFKEATVQCHDVILCILVMFAEFLDLDSVS